MGTKVEGVPRKKHQERVQGHSLRLHFLFALCTSLSIVKVAAATQSFWLGCKLVQPESHSSAKHSIPVFSLYWRWTSSGTRLEAACLRCCCDSSRHCLDDEICSGAAINTRSSFFWPCVMHAYRIRLI